jgi:hypothetical protein
MMAVPNPLQHVIERLVHEHRADAVAFELRGLRRLVGARLSWRAARAAAPRVLEHKWLLSERLGRDVGLRVAALDYFENLAGPVPRA